MTYKFENIDFYQLKKTIDADPDFCLYAESDEKDLILNLIRKNKKDGINYELVLWLFFENPIDDIEGDGVYAQEITLDYGSAVEEGCYSSDINGIKSAIRSYIHWGGFAKDVGAKHMLKQMKSVTVE